FCYVRDTVEALVRLQSSAASRGRIFNVGGTEEISIEALARLVIELLNSKSTLEFVPYGQAYAPGFEDMRRRKPVVDKIAEVTGFRPATPLREIVKLTAADFEVPGASPLLLKSKEVS
ncbi:MAG: NAD-dependent epimerase/dehydratase family protein, partial [Limisphaerales bacterium]